MLEHRDASEPSKGIDPKTTNSDNQQVTTFEIGWLIGFIEGEGSLGLYWGAARNQIRPVLMITNTDYALVEYGMSIIHKMGVGCFIYKHTMNKLPRHWKQRYDIHVHGIKRLGKFLEMLIPLWPIDTIKKRKAKIVLEFCQSRLTNPLVRRGHGSRETRYTQEEHEIFERVKNLV